MRTIETVIEDKKRTRIDKANLAPPLALSKDELNKIDAYWRACCYLALGMTYLKANPLLKEPLRLEHVKDRMLGHWGTSPGLASVTSISTGDQGTRSRHSFMAGPGHGRRECSGPCYLEGAYSEVYPDCGEDADGMQRLFKRFSSPGGIGSHCTPETPGSIHEGGELGYVLSHACGAAFDNPGLIVAAVVGDGEAETGPLATSWHINKFLNPIRDGAVLPILHLNGYKINNPTIWRASLTRRSRRSFAGRVDALLRRGVRPGVDAPGDGRHDRHVRRSTSAPSRRRRERAAAPRRAGR